MNVSDVKTKKNATKVPSLEELCQKRISNYDFERLNEIANTSKHHVTKAFKNSSIMEHSLLIAIARLLDESPIYLMDTYGCGLDSISARQHRALLELENNEISE